MAHGTPDWGVTAGAVTTYQLTDLAEAVARLGSLDTFDRRGDLIWGDGFEFGLNKWTTISLGIDGSVVLSSAEARNGRYSCLLTAGSDGALPASIEHVNPFPVLSNLGLECSFNLPSVIDNLELRVEITDGSFRTQYRVRWRDTDDDLQYFSSTAAYVTFATGISLNRTATLFHTAKLVIDAATGQYIRFILDSAAYSLAAIAGQASADSTFPRFRVLVQHLGRAGFNDQVYVDDAIITQNEPA